MGNSISISFLKRNVDDEDEIVESVVLFSHWQGRRLLALACTYLEQLRAANRGRSSLDSWPLERLEPRTVIVDFIGWMSSAMPLMSRDIYLGRVQVDSRYLHHGHFTFDLDQWRFTEHDTGRTYSISVEARRTSRLLFSDPSHGFTSAK